MDQSVEKRARWMVGNPSFEKVLLLAETGLGRAETATVAAGAVGVCSAISYLSASPEMALKLGVTEQTLGLIGHATSTTAGIAIAAALLNAGLAKLLLSVAKRKMTPLLKLKPPMAVTEASGLLTNELDAGLNATNATNATNAKNAEGARETAPSENGLKKEAELIPTLKAAAWLIQKTVNQKGLSTGVSGDDEPRPPKNKM